MKRVPLGRRDVEDIAMLGPNSVPRQSGQRDGRSWRPRPRRGLAAAVKVLRVTGPVRFQRGSNASRCTAMHAGGVTALETERAHARQARLGVSLRPTRGTFPPSFWVFHRFLLGQKP